MRRVEHPAAVGRLARMLSGGLTAAVAAALLAMLPAAPARATDMSVGLQLYGASGDDVGYAPQLRTDVSIRVTGTLGRVRVQQRFHNPTDAWVEGVYVFPLPEDAAVDRLRMRYGGRLIEGEIQERQQARATYQAARARGQGAGLLDQQRANVFSSTVANIPPGEEVLIEIGYRQAVHWQDGEFSLRFPTVVAPRYIPGTPLAGAAQTPAGHGWAMDTDQVADASHITPPVVAGADAGHNPVVITAELDIGLALDDIRSPHHRIVTEQVSPGRYRVALRAGSVPAERDFVLRWRPALALQPSAALFAQTWQARHYGLLMVMPPDAAALPEPVARELVLVVDTSGSMHGESIAQARAAVLSALRRLRPADRFNVIQFSDRTRALFERAMPADPAHLQLARRYVRALHAEGGTEMLPALRLALHDPQPRGLLRQVVFITDGAVGNEQALFRTVTQDIGASRLFTVGIGSAPNGLFMRRAAAFGRGTFTYIGSTAQVEHEVGGLFRQLSRPALTDLRVRWLGADGTGTVVQAPQVVPDLYAGEPLVLAVQSAAPLQRVEIEGRLGERRWQHSVTLHAAAAADGVHALWARRMIDDWMARLVSGEDSERVRAAVLSLALGHQLVSRYTSLVAVDRSPARPPHSGLRSAAVPSRLPTGWSASAVFGRLPGTATPAALYLLIGLSALAIAWLAGRRPA